jgi:hypothetical protein
LGSTGTWGLVQRLRAPLQHWCRARARLLHVQCGGELRMANPSEHLVDWLRDAYAMEKQAEKHA